MASLGAPVLLATVLAAHLLTCPYTKVEESFSLQAVHDILTYGVFPTALGHYDHVQFPGAVPRSFVGPLLLAAFAAPLQAVARVLGLVSTSADAQLLVRGTLAAAAWASLIHFGRRAVPRGAENAFWLICAAQFHLPFWASRTTPNGIAFPIVTAGLAEVIGGRMPLGLAALTLTALIFRLEVVALAGAAYLYVWLYRRMPFWRTVAIGLVSTAAGAALTLTVDTYFWHPVPNMPLPPIYNGLVWPEVSAVLFNVVDGRSAEWGVSPPLHYWTNALPKLLMFTSALVFVRPLSHTLAPLAIAVAHVATLSLVKHKEWRFIVYTLPLWNMAAAAGAAACRRRRYVRLVPPVLVALTAFASAAFAWVSMHNYPGGVALRELHSRAQGAGRVHICVHATMTGVSRFQSIHMSRPAYALVPSAAPTWIYDKTETPGPNHWDNVTWTITDGPCSGAFVQLGPPVHGLVGLASPREMLSSATFIRTAPLFWICTNGKGVQDPQEPQNARHLRVRQMR